MFNYLNSMGHDLNRAMVKVSYDFWFLEVNQFDSSIIYVPMTVPIYMIQIESSIHPSILSREHLRK